MAINFDQAFGVHQYTMGIRTTRAEVLAGNLANADTPGYKARDLDFDLALKEAANLTEIKHGPALVKTSSRHMDLDALQKDPELLMKYRLPYQADTGNGNTVEVSTERMKYVNNTIEYQASMQFLTGRITKLMSALRTQS